MFPAFELVYYLNFSEKKVVVKFFKFFETKNRWIRFFKFFADLIVENAFMDVFLMVEKSSLEIF